MTATGALASALILQGKVPNLTALLGHWRVGLATGIHHWRQVSFGPYFVWPFLSLLPVYLEEGGGLPHHMFSAVMFYLLTGQQTMKRGLWDPEPQPTLLPLVVSVRYSAQPQKDNREN